MHGMLSANGAMPGNGTAKHGPMLSNGQQLMLNAKNATNGSSQGDVASGNGRRHKHPHFCLYGTLHLLGGMKLLLAIGVLVLVALCVLEAIYFRRALFIMVLPALVSALSAAALARSDPRLLWPIIGISFFHLFLDAYVTLIFLFFFLFKPLYIIMVLNWAFDTLHTTKTPSYYAHCAAIFTALALFFLYNLWQLRISLRFQNYLDELLNSGSSATASTTSGASNDSSGNECKHRNGQLLLTGQQPPSAAVHHCKVLNEPPIVLMCNGNANGHNHQQKMLLCPSPALSQRGGPHQVRPSLGPRRPSLGESRQFGTR